MKKIITILILTFFIFSKSTNAQMDSAKVGLSVGFPIVYFDIGVHNIQHKHFGIQLGFSYGLTNLPKNDDNPIEPLWMEIASRKFLGSNFGYIGGNYRVFKWLYPYVDLTLGAQVTQLKWVDTPPIVFADAYRTESKFSAGIGVGTYIHIGNITSKIGYNTICKGATFSIGYIFTSGWAMRYSENHPQ